MVKLINLPDLLFKDKKTRDKSDFIKKIKKENNPEKILGIMESSGLKLDNCKIGMPLLKLEDKTDEEIMLLVEKYPSNYYLSREAAKNLGSRKSMAAYQLIRNARDPETIRIACRLLSRLKKDENKMMELAKEMDYGQTICEAIAPLITSEENIKLILKMTNGNAIAVSRAIRLFTKEEDIIALVKNHPFSEFICQEALAKLKLQEKTKERIYLIMEASGYAEYFCASCCKILRRA